MINKVRFAMFGLLVAAGFALAPSAFARGHVNLGINIGLPGIGIGFSDCRHCGWGGNHGGYYGGGYYSGYVAPAYYAPSYYGPSYYGASYYNPGYYESSYYGYPSYGSVYYSSGSGHRGHYSGRHHDRDDRRHGGDYGHRASYYDRSGSYRH